MPLNGTITNAPVIALFSGLFLGLLGCGRPLVLQRELAPQSDSECTGDSDSISDEQLRTLADHASDSLAVPINVPSTSCTRSGLSCEPITDDRRAVAALVVHSLEQELKRYGSDLRSISLRRISLVSELRSTVAAWSPGALTFVSDRSIYLNVDALCSPDWRKATIHHEIFHLLDADVKPANNANDSTWWDQLNPPGFSYSDDYNLADAGRSHPAQGFVTDYARTNRLEDKADTFAFSVVPELQKSLAQWTADDPYLRAKSAALKSAVTQRWPGLESLFRQTAEP